MATKTLRETILNKPRKFKREAVEFMGETVWAWGLNGSQRALVEESRTSVDPKTGQVRVHMRNFRATVIVAGTRESGEDEAKGVFTPGDEAYLNQLPADELDRLATKILRLSGMATGDLEEAEKNSSPADGSTSSTASPAT